MLLNGGVKPFMDRPSYAEAKKAILDAAMKMRAAVIPLNSHVMGVVIKKMGSTTATPAASSLMVLRR